MTDKPLSPELRSQIVMSCRHNRTEFEKSHPFQFYKKLAQKFGIDSYAKCFGHLNVTETWERLVRYEGELPPPESIERTTITRLPKHLSVNVGVSSAIPMQEYRPNYAKAQINVVTDITPESILQLPILPLSSPQFLPAERGLFFVMASKTEPKVIYVGKSKNLKASWEPVYKNISISRCPIAGHRRREMTTLTNLELDLYIRWILLPATNESSMWQEDTDNTQLSLCQAHANKVLSPFFLGREIEDETTLDWGGLPASRNIGKMIEIKTYRVKTHR